MIWEPVVNSIEMLVFALLYALVICLVFTVSAKLIMRGELSLSRTFATYMLFSSPIAVLGYATGMLTGLSNVTTTSTVLPAGLTFLGGVNVYLFGADSKFKFVVGYCVVVFVLELFAGISRGAIQREIGREDYLKMVSQRELRVRDYREVLKLPTDIPDWAFSGRPK